jgi:hypothetical protein
MISPKLLAEADLPHPYYRDIVHTFAMMATQAAFTLHIETGF